MINYFMFCLANRGRYLLSDCPPLRHLQTGVPVWKPDSSCSILEFLIRSSFTVQLGILTAAAVDRHLALYRPIKFVNSLHGALRMIGTAIFGGFLVCVPVWVLYGTRAVEVQHQSANLTTHI